MKILITGGAGCLGSNLVEYWLPKGHEILVIDNFVTGKREVVPEVDGLLVKEGSVCDVDFLSRCFDDFKPEVVIHSAASYKDPHDWKADAETNVTGSINVAKLCEKYEVERLINFQTALCYGRPKVLPIPIDHPVAPFTSYGISKTAGESFVMLANVPTLSLRIANVTGPRLAIGPIPTFYKRLKNAQSCFCTDSVRDFIDMSDFLSFMDLAVKTDAPTGVFNVSTGKGHTIKEIYDLVVEYLGVNGGEVPVLPVGDDDVAAVYLDAKQTESAFNWKATTSFKDTITKQLQWYDHYGVSDVYSHLKSSS